MNDILAEKLIDKISDLTDYDVSIINESGIVVASRRKEYVGAFHETAFDIMNGKEDVISVDIAAPDSGVKEGVYMAMYARKQKTGVVGVMGNPDEVMAIAKMIRMSMEVMMEFEMYKSNGMRRYSTKERLMQTLLYSENGSRGDIESYFDELNLKKDLVRIPVLIKMKKQSRYLEEMHKMLEMGSLYSNQDLKTTTEEGYIFLFKSIESTGKMIMQDYKYLLGEYLAPMLQFARANGLDCSLYVGPLQNDVVQYRQAFLYCMWMQRNIAGQGSYYFYDYIVKYLESMASQSEYNTIFLYLKKELGQKFIDNYLELMGVLVEQDYNLLKASQALHVHKNTLIYRLDKVREVLNMNPLTHNANREFMECFYYYLKRSR